MSDKDNKKLLRLVERVAAEHAAELDGTVPPAPDGEVDGAGGDNSGWAVQESPGLSDAGEAAQPKAKAEPITAILEPRSLAEFTGQPDAVRRLEVAIRASKNRGRPLPPLLMAGPPGLGKTTLAHICAFEMLVDYDEVMGPAIGNPGQLADVMERINRMGDNPILFIDEIHRVPRKCQELMYNALTHGHMDVPVKGGVDRININPFTLIGATTEEGLLTGPMRRRFGITVLFRFYTAGALALMVMASAERMGVQIEPESAGYLAGRSRGTPSHANRLLQRADEMAAYHGSTQITPAIVQEAMQLEGIDDNGLNYQDWLYLHALADQFEGGPAGSASLSASTAISLKTIEEVVEPYLLHLRAIARTAQGRVLTNHGRTLIRQRKEAGA